MVGSKARQQSGVLAVRNAFADFAQVESEEMFAGPAGADPLVTIAIPTYRRPDLLAETVASAIGQSWDRPFEVVVVDDDPASIGHERLLKDVPDIADANFRYLRNRENLRDFGNHSRCVEAARGEWVTILHDDDLLDRNFLAAMFPQLEADPSIDGLVCRKRYIDQRELSFEESRRRRLARRAVDTLTFGGRSVRTITARKLFWGCITGNTVGFLFRKRDALALGGFYTENYPSADYYFYARFAERFRLCETRQVLATIRLAVNVSMRKETQLAAFERGFALQRAYAGTVLPGYYRSISPLLMARQIALMDRVWRAQVTVPEVEERIGISIPRDRPALLYALRALLRGY
jgi:glycosyltransferase involved in cell wall biosynthesis